MKTLSLINTKLLSIASGILLSLACIFPDSYIYGATFAFIGIIIFFILVNNTSGKKIDFFLIGIIFHFISMFWLWETIGTFGGFSKIISFFIFCLFVLTGSFQFLLVYILQNYLKKYFSINSSLIISWLTFEFFYPRLFPWGIGNFFISIKSITGLSEVFGVKGVSFIILILVCSFYKIIEKIIEKKSLLKPTCIFFILCFFFVTSGYSLNSSIKSIEGYSEESSALVVQGNISLEEKENNLLKQDNIKKYINLSLSNLSSNPDFIIWPETVIGNWADLNSKNSYYGEDPLVSLNYQLVYGGLGFTRSLNNLKEPNIYNATLLRGEDGETKSVYAKKVLMPFGEYVPFSETFPFLLNILPIKPFSVGSWDEPFNIKTKYSSYKAGILICYEDLVANLSRDSVLRGSQLLINLTNDAWYGQSSAPFQHDLLARFRAIENRRYLIRSTNTGYTTLINPYGEIVNSLPLFKETTDIFKFRLLNIQTIYTRYGDLPYFITLFFYVCYNLVLNRKINNLK